MKPITAAIQAILDADWSQPVTTVEITLRDDPVTPTIVRVADHGVTIGGDVFTPDLVSLPSIIADVTKGLDHVRFQLNNADWAYSVYDNANWLDGASVRIEQYYATNPEYTTFEGPVVAFIGLVTDATPVSDGKIDVVVSSGGGSLIDGNIGRLITGRCMHTYRDAGCGYDHSATVATGGLYTFGNWIPINETAVAGQDGLAMGASSWPGAEKPFNFVQIRRGGSVVYGEFGSLAIADVDLPNKQFSLDSTVTLEIGDKVEYLTCPRDTMETCAARWKVGEATPQQDKFLGFDYHREKYRRVAVPKQGLRALMPDVVGSIVPILYGERAIEPLIFGVHEYAGKHYVVCLMGEGEIGGITDVENDIYFDGAPLRSSQTYNDGVAAKISVAVGTPTQVKITNAPEWDSAVGSTVRGLSAFPNIGHFGLQLPDNYELNPQVSVVDRKIGERMVGSPVGIFNEPIFERTRFWSVTSPDLMVKGVGKEVYTYTLVGGVPTKSGSPSYTRNPIWHVLDLLTAEARTGPSDVFSAGIDPADLLLESFIIWAAYCDDSVSVRDVSRALVSRPRFEASLHITKGVNRRQAIDDLLQSCRGSLVERGGQLGVVLDAPLGGKGSISGATATTLTDDARDGADLPTWPDGGDNGALEGLRVKILTGAGAGQVRFIASNTVDTLTVTAAWDTTPDPADTYAVFSVELNDSNMGRLSLPKAAPTYRLTNSLTVRYEDEEYFGREATLPVVDNIDGDDGNTHAEVYGINASDLNLPTITNYSQAAREGWYQLRKGLDTNRIFKVTGANIEALPLEAGDVFLLNTAVSGITDELVRVERTVARQDAAFDITGRLFREHIYLDWPTVDFDSIDLSSDLIPPHSVPPHVTNLQATITEDETNGGPLVKVTWDRALWPYAGWEVAVEARYELPDTEWGEWVQMATARGTAASFRASEYAHYQIRAVMVSHVAVRANDPILSGTSSGGNTSSTLNDTSQAWITDEFDGAWVRIVSGTSADEEFEVASNTADELTITGGTWAVTPDDTSVYEIFVPAPTDEVVVITEFSSEMGLNDFRIKEETDDEVVYEYLPGIGVTDVYIWILDHKLPVTTGIWPDDIAPTPPVTSIVTPTGSPLTVTVQKPPGGWVTALHMEPRAGAVVGPVIQELVTANLDPDDRIVSGELIVDQEDGSVLVRLNAGYKTLSLRTANVVGASPAKPVVGVIEAGTIRTLSSDLEFTLGSGTVPRGQKIAFGAAPYINNDGTGFNSDATEHGDLFYLEGARTNKIFPSLEVTHLDEQQPNGPAEFGVTLRDPDGVLDSLRVIKQSRDVPVSDTLVDATPNDGAEYIQTVPIHEQHMSYITFRGLGTLEGQAIEALATSPGYDKGSWPSGVVSLRLDESDDTASIVTTGDYDTDNAVALITTDGSEPNAATVVSTGTPLAGRVNGAAAWTTAGVGESIVAGEVVKAHVVFRDGSNGYVGVIRAEAVYAPIVPWLEVLVNEESGGNLVFRVDVHDPGGQLDEVVNLTRTLGDGWSGESAPMSPVIGSEYEVSLGLEEGRQKQIRIVVRSTVRNTPSEAYADSSPGDFGVIPNVFHLELVVDQSARTASPLIVLDADGDQMKVYSQVFANQGAVVYPSQATVDSSGTLFDTGGIDRTLTPGEFRTQNGGVDAFVGMLPGKVYLVSVIGVNSVTSTKSTVPTHFEYTTPRKETALWVEPAGRAYFKRNGATGFLQLILPVAFGTGTASLKFDWAVTTPSDSGTFNEDVTPGSGLTLGAFQLKDGIVIEEFDPEIEYETIQTTITPYSGAGATGDPGEPIIMVAAGTGADINDLLTITDTDGGSVGPEIVLAKQLRKTVLGDGSILIGLAPADTSAGTVLTSTWTADAETGVVFEITAGADIEIKPPTNWDSGETVHIFITNTSNWTITLLASDWDIVSFGVAESIADYVVIAMMQFASGSTVVAMSYEG